MQAKTSCAILTNNSGRKKKSVIPPIQHNTNTKQIALFMATLLQCCFVISLLVCCTLGGSPSDCYALAPGTACDMHTYDGAHYCYSCPFDGNCKPMYECSLCKQQLTQSACSNTRTGDGNQCIWCQTTRTCQVPQVSCPGCAAMTNSSSCGAAWADTTNHCQWCPGARSCYTPNTPCPLCSSKTTATECQAWSFDDNHKCLWCPSNGCRDYSSSGCPVAVAKSVEKIRRDL